MSSINRSLICSACAPLSPPYCMLRKTVEDRDYKKIRFLIQTGINPLYEAVASGDLQLVKHVASLGAKAEISRNSCVEYLAMKIGRLDLFQVVIEDCRGNIDRIYKGNTLSHHVTGLYDCIELKQYIFGKADLNILDEHGRSVLFHLEAQRPSNLKTLRQLVINNISKKTLEDTQISLHTNYLAHVWKIGGYSYSRRRTSAGATKIKLEGSYTPYMHKKIWNSLRRFTNDWYLPQPVPDFSKFILALKTSNYSRYTNFEQLQFYTQNDFLILKVGYKGHAVFILLFKEFFILLNRGGCKRKTVEVFSFNPEKFTASTIKCLQKISVMKSLDYKNHFFSDLLHLIDLNKTPTHILLEDQLTLDKQEVGNCAFENSEGLVFLYLVFQNLHKMNLLETLELTAIEGIVETQKKIYEMWLSENKNFALQEYMTLVDSPNYPNKVDSYFLNKINEKRNDVIQTETKEKRIVGEKRKIVLTLKTPDEKKASLSEQVCLKR